MKFPIYADCTLWPTITAYTGAVNPILLSLPPVLRAPSPATVVAVQQQAAKISAPYVTEFGGVAADVADPNAVKAACADLYLAVKAAAKSAGGQLDSVIAGPASFAGRSDQTNLASMLATADDYMISLGIADLYASTAIECYWPTPDEANWRMLSGLMLDGAARYGRPVDVYLSLDYGAEAGNPLTPAQVRTQFEAAADWIVSGRAQRVFLIAGYNGKDGRIPYVPSRDDPGVLQMAQTCGLPIPSHPPQPVTVVGGAGN